jgi:hypothetical protein
LDADANSQLPIRPLARSVVPIRSIFIFPIIEETTTRFARFNFLPIERANRESIYGLLLPLISLFSLDLHL